MTFGEVFKELINGRKIKRKDWKGYWAWEDNTIMIHCENNKIFDIRETDNPMFTFANIAADDWELVSGNERKWQNGKSIQI